MLRSLLRTLLVVAVLGLAVTGKADAGTLEDARAAYERGDDHIVLQLLRPLADAGDPEAQFALGLLFFEGRGVSQDAETAAEWFRRAAEQGKADAQANLGILYNVGRGVPQDVNEAAVWLRRAAEQGHAGAQSYLADLYHEGRGVVQDDGAMTVPRSRQRDS
jgi:TPR repeat protein